MNGRGGNEIRREGETQLMSWIMLFYDALEDYQLLTDEQFGKLIRAALLFAQKGTEPTFDGPEAYLWPGLRNRLIRDKESYEEKCRQNAENVRKRWSKEGKNADPHTAVYGRIPSHTNGYESYEDKEEVKDKEEIKEESKVKSESESENNAREALRTDGYTDDEIDQALSRIPEGSRIRNLRAYLRKAIDEERRNGKRVPAQRYEQRDYSGEQEEAMQRMINDMEKRGIV